MKALTKMEIHAIMRLVADNRDESDACRKNPNNIYRALHNLEYENMCHIYDTLQAVLDTDARRIAID